MLLSNQMQNPYICWLTFKKLHMTMFLHRDECLPTCLDGKAGQLVSMTIMSAIYNVIYLVVNRPNCATATFNML